jgi:hypothetical protein
MGNIEHDGTLLMREQPTGEQLLDTARTLLKNNVLPLLQGDARRDLLMVMNALGIAQRELQVGTAADEAERKSLAQLMGNPVDELELANRQLAQNIRQGMADPGNSERAAVLAHLRQVGASRLQVSNPKVLKP